MLVGELLARPVCHFLGYLYPAYQSYKAVKANDPSLHTQWLTFWIVNTYFSFAETFGDTLLSWLPFYYEAKVAVLIWLVAPQFKGATKIYERVVDPYLHRYEKDIDANLDHVKRRSARELGNLSRLGIEHLRSHSAEFLRLGQSVLLKQLATEAAQRDEGVGQTNAATSSSSVSATRATIVRLDSDLDENKIVDELDADFGPDLPDSVSSDENVDEKDDDYFDSD
ncbi:Receptor expression-enhancing protein 4 [Hondaea fermentalgiana]|uniref:Receptor expression-enhancing protein 4 n=1 Tax=Hondaea fermentalgiana TaxID=2315210 RepID=A0A2R5GG17_9STRA|nr:Receptor expression-enhancing protein 4 [Hondaea fermentalgiana]|eukprot:GBG27583.1 Receptor expression-enhancing protein 4 [Hondaea fermentalgiana]